MGSFFLRSSRIRLVLALAAISLPLGLIGQKLSDLAPEGEAVYRQKLDTYPPFDEDAAKKKSETECPLYEKGQEISVVYRGKIAKGKLLGHDSRTIRVGTTGVPVVDVDPAFFDHLDPKKNEERRKQIIRIEKNKYNDEKLRFMKELKEEIHTKYPAINEKLISFWVQKIGDPELKKTCLEEIRKTYSAALPLQAEGQDAMNGLLEKSIRSRQDLAVHNGQIWQKKELEAELAKIAAAEKKRLDRINERFLRPKCATPSFEPDGVKFEPGMEITVSCATEDSEIRFSCDGSEPNENSELYSAPIKLEKASTIKARAFHPYFNDSDTGNSGDWLGGLYASYFSTMTAKGATFTRVDPQIDFDWRTEKPHENTPENLMTVIWTGTLVPQKTDTYTFYLKGDDGIRLWLNGNLIIDGWKEQPPTEYEKTNVKLKAGEKYDIKVALAEVLHFTLCKLEWASPSVSRSVIPQSCFFPDGKSTDLMKKWNSASRDSSGAVSYPNRAKMANPLGSPYKLTLKGASSEARWQKLNIGE